MSKPDLIFTGDGKAIAEVLGHLASSIAKKSTLPILSCVELSVRGGKLHAAATNLDQLHRVELPVGIEVGKDGAGTCAALGLLTGILARCNGDGARVMLQDGKLNVSAGGRKASMMVLPLAEFPQSGDEPREWQTVESPPIAAAVRGVSFASSLEETRYVLNGVHLSSDGLAVATDGRRLAQVTYTDSPASALAGVIIPNAALGTLVELLERHTRVEVAGDEGGIWIRTEGESFFTKVIEGNYPNFRQVIPSFTQATKLTVERSALQKALSWAKLYRTAKDHSVRLASDGGNLIISVTSPEIGEAEDSIPLIRSDGDPMKVALSMKFLDEMVGRDGGDYFTLETEPQKDGTVTCPLLIHEDNENFLGVLMPMRLA
jgi:DNA polymerase III subunit beta